MHGAAVQGSGSEGLQAQHAVTNEVHLTRRTGVESGYEVRTSALIHSWVPP